ncbi:MAG: hypothetical protein M0R80_04745 [Proteobacteria bacterium]|jgi:hypothetical protein|nr:hypothetical protein [Pseudomonadota bacterium]
MDRMDGMDGKYLRMFLTLVALAAACGPMAGTTQPEWTQSSDPKTDEYDPDYVPRGFDPCAMTASIDPIKRSLAAIILALQSENWTIHKIDQERNSFFADICYRDDNRYCAVVLFQVGEHGGVLAKPDYIQPKVVDDLERWFVSLERSFNNYRCYSDALLREEVRKYGIVY